MGIIQKKIISQDIKYALSAGIGEKNMVVVITCVDPRVTTHIEESLGLDRGEAFIIRIAGAIFSLEGEVMQSLRLVVEQFEITDIYILGHTDCRAAKVSGLSEEEIVAKGIRLLSESPELPSNLSVGGGVLSLSTGELHQVNGKHD